MARKALMQHRMPGMMITDQEMEEMMAGMMQGSRRAKAKKARSKPKGRARRQALRG